jgi:hypothetical protein
MAMRCTSRRTDGKPCGAWAMRGQTACVRHSGAAEQNRPAGVRHLALASAQRMVALSGVQADPIAHLLGCLHHSATLVNVWGVMVAALDDASEAESRAGERLRGELRYSAPAPDTADVLSVSSNERLLQYNPSLAPRARFAAMCVEAGVSERQIALAERMGEQLSSLFERTVAAIEGLSDAQRFQAATAYTREIAALEHPAIGPDEFTAGDLADDTNGP